MMERDSKGRFVKKAVKKAFKAMRDAKGRFMKKDTCCKGDKKDCKCKDKYSVASALTSLFGDKVAPAKIGSLELLTRDEPVLKVVAVALENISNLITKTKEDVNLTNKLRDVFSKIMQGKEVTDEDRKEVLEGFKGIINSEIDTVTKGEEVRSFLNAMDDLASEEIVNAAINDLVDLIAEVYELPEGTKVKVDVSIEGEVENEEEYKKLAARLKKLRC